MLNDDTIAAISTPLGEGGIGIVRLSGKDSLDIVDKIFLSPKNKRIKGLRSYQITYGYIIDPATGEKIDEVIVSVMKSPYSYTREDVVEINCHGGMIPLRKTLEVVLKQGARLAEPGEFTKRAFINGRIDLSQAEAVLDLIRAKTEESSRIAFEQLQGGLSEKITDLRDKLIGICAHVEAYIDFPEDEIEVKSDQTLLENLRNVRTELEALLKTYNEARFFREGLAIAIVGRPNVGKSSLLNTLLKKDRAIVTEIPGTTRDIIEEYLNIKGLPIRIMDTAGIRDVEDIAEKEGVRRSIKSIENADLVIAIFDRSESHHVEDLEIIEKIKNKNIIVVFNKSDLPPILDKKIIISQLMPYTSNFLDISALRGDGIEELKNKIFESCLKDWKEEREGVVVSNLRHKLAIEKASEAIGGAIRALIENYPLEIFALELREALDRLGEIVGVVTTDDILNRIFSEFCIGK